MRNVLLFLFLLGKSGFLFAQTADSIQKNSRYNVLISWHNQNLAMPLQNLLGNFSNPGLGVGLAYAYGPRSPFRQELELGFVYSKNIGSSCFALTRIRAAMALSKKLSFFVGLGLGWQKLYHPSRTWVYQDGQWQEKRDAQHQLMIPFRAGVEAKIPCKNKLIKPFCAYQVALVSPYDNVLPVLFFSQLSFGLSIPLSHEN